LIPQIKIPAPEIYLKDNNIKNIINKIDNNKYAFDEKLIGRINKCQT